jgi:hypothetical protein
MTTYWRLRYTIDVLWVLLKCRLFGHDWDYHAMTNLEGSLAYFRFCMRCERAEELEGYNHERN